MHPLLEKIQKWPVWLHLLNIIVCISLFAWLDYKTGYESAFAPLYLIPVSYATWCLGRYPSLIIALTSVFIWHLVNTLAGETHAQTFTSFWNASLQFLVLVLVIVLLINLKKGYEKESKLARTDFLTGAANSRALWDIAEHEIKRAERYKMPFTVAYIDIDNFQQINDKEGHSVGDKVLKEVINAIQSNLRASDTVARMGGDEFAILLPATNTDAARDVMPKLQRIMLDKMIANSWPVTFSIGAVTFQTPPESVDAMLKTADQLMHSVKSADKNAVEYMIYR
ncbi:MAG: GGDEF domain-containing protein [Gammaproteobacteria bacterium]|nr:GGDEF domain-containing protein [Gammaproteobacteria bacterium]